MLKILELLGLPPDHQSARALAYFAVTGIPPKQNTIAFANAGFLLGLLATVARPAGVDVIRRWLAPIVGGCKVGFLSEEELKLRVTAVVGALKGLPEFCFTESTQVQVLRACEFVPTAAEIWNLLGPINAEFEKMKSDLNRMLDRGVYAPLPAPEEVAELGWDKLPEPLVLKLAAPVSPTV